MGWNVEGRGLAPDDREVIIERSLNDEDGKKFVDYTFRIKGRPQFLVEAKRPSESLKKSSHIFQAKRYAFSTGVPFVILTNFREFRLYKITVKPLINQPNTDLVEEFDLTYRDYSKSCSLLWKTFQRDNVEKGSLAEFYIDSLGPDGKPDLNYTCIKGSSLLNKEFLKDLLRWRGLLARDIVQHNRSLSAPQISEAVQRLLDRIIFLRILEDREIESQELLRETVSRHARESKPIKPALDSLCISLNAKYNGLLFHSHELLEKIAVSDGTLKQLIEELYYPRSPYNFKKISVEILGRIFEQYLGVTLRKSGRRVSFQPKPELKKGEGAYYTPQEIVTEIVEGCLNQNFPSGLKNYTILDPACGSGSFLINAFKSLARRHEGYYARNSAARLKALQSGALVRTENGIHLSVGEKKRLLTSSIFGVDLDPQAVEIAKMSLYIAMLEGPLGGLPRPALPDLQKNVCCGNSIIDSDYYANYAHDLAVNPFDWETQFKAPISEGGFDSVVGNPPYIRIQTFERINPPSVKKYINDVYRTSRHGNFDISIVFVEKALGLLKCDGALGMILPNKFLTSEYGTGLRALIAGGQHLRRIIYFGDQQVFDGSTTYTCILLLGKKGARQFGFVRVKDINRWKIDRKATVSKLSSEGLSGEAWHFGLGNSAVLLRNPSASRPLSHFAKVFVGLQTDCDEIFLLEKKSRKGKIQYCRSDYTDKVHPFEVRHLKKVLKGAVDIERYACADRLRLIFPYALGPRRPPIFSPSAYRKQFPLTWGYLNACKDRLRRGSRRQLKGDWYGYVYKKNHSRFEQSKIVVPSLCKGSRFALDESGDSYFLGSGIGGGGGYGIVLNETAAPLTLLSLLGILNSNLVNDWILERGSPFSGGWIGIDKRFIDGIPIPLIRPGERRKVEALEQIEKYAQAIIRLNRDHKMGKIPDEKKQSWIAGLEAKVDKLVEQLYGIPPSRQRTSPLSPTA